MIHIMERNNKMVLNEKGPSLAIHPGEVLQEELKSRGLLQNAFASRIGMQPSHLSALIHGRRNVTPAIARKLEEELGIPATTWLNLQNLYNLKGFRNSGLVHGYSLQPANREWPEAHYLHDSSTEKDTQTTVCLSLPDSDYSLLLSLASRMGWQVK